MTSYLTIHTSLDDSVKRDRKFWLQRIEGEEGLCEDFNYRLELSSLERIREEEIKSLLGKTITVEIAYLDVKHKIQQSYINGIVFSIVEVGLSRAPHSPDIWRYEAEIGPWFRKLDYVKDCRVIQKGGNNSLKIITDLFHEFGFRDFRDKTKGRLPNRDYSVIYNETLSNYIKRICQEDGIIWRYEHSKKRHELLFYNDSTRLPKLPDVSRAGKDGVLSFCQERIHMPLNASTIASYEWDKSPVKTISKRLGAAKGILPDYQYDVGFKSRAEGDKKAERQINTLKNRQACFYGESTMRHFSAGASFNLHAPTLPEHHQESFLIKKLRIEATEATYSNSFEALPAGNRYFPDCDNEVHKPVVVGTQTAVVVGAAGKNKVSTNKMGQVKVRFHWDHLSPKDAAHTSAFVRVSYPAAGSQRGFVFTPRIGEEVVVSYENGNPEKPLILGGAYSHRNQTPHIKPSGSLADSIMDTAGMGNGGSYSSPVSQLHTGTIKSDQDSDSNRLTFDDKSGKEKLEINAKKDLNIDVGNDLDIEVEEDIFILMNQENINASENVKSQAGGSIINATLTAVTNTAGSDISHMALGSILNIAGGVISNMAGATITNTAILSVENEAGGPLSQDAATLLANTSLGAVLQMGESISQEGDLAVTNISLADIMNNASKEIKTKTLFQKVKTDNEATTETGKYELKGLLPKIN